MPRRRTARAAPAKRQIPPLPEDSNENESILDEHQRRQKVDTLILDFKTEISSRIRDLKQCVVNLLGQIDLAYSMEIVKIPSEIRCMKLDDYLAHGGSFQPAPVEDSLSSQIRDIIGSNLHPVAEEDHELTKTVQTVKRVRKVPALGTAQQTSRCSGRTKKAALETPAIQSRMMLPIQTPLITPKFDPRLYRTVAASARGPRRGEAVMSMEGSPIAVPAQNTKFLVPIDGAKTMDLWDIVDNPESVDHNTLEKASQTMEELKKRIDAIINFNSKPKN